MPRVKVLFGEQVQETKALQEGEIVIGRARECSLVIDNLGVSRRHCRLAKDGEGWSVEDLGSQNGTFLNGERLAGKKTLKHGDRIGIGKHSLLYEEAWEGMGQEGPELPGARKSKAFLGDVEHTMAVETYRTKKFQASAMAAPAPGGAAPGAAPAAAPARRCYLWEAKTGKTFDLAKPETVLGKRRNADVPLRGLFVAPWHATIRRQGEDFYINHLAGWSAVRVNGRKIRDVRLENRDLIEIGRNELQFIIAEPGERPIA